MEADLMLFYFLCAYNLLICLATYSGALTHCAVFYCMATAPTDYHLGCVQILLYQQSYNEDVPASVSITKQLPEKFS